MSARCTPEEERAAAAQYEAAGDANAGEPVPEYAVLAQLGTEPLLAMILRQLIRANHTLDRLATQRVTVDGREFAGETVRASLAQWIERVEA